MHVKRVLRAPQNSVWDVPKPFKIEPWDDPGSQNVALKFHRAAKPVAGALGDGVVTGELGLFWGELANPPHVPRAEEP